MKIETLSLNGIAFRYCDLNIYSHNIIVFVPGAFSSIESWLSMKKEWKLDYRSVYIELPGFGKSDFLHESYSFDFYVACISEVICRLNLKNFCLYGYSYGAVPVFKYALQSTVISKMILGGCCAWLDSLMIDQIRELVFLADRRDNLFFSRFQETFINKEKLANIKRGRVSEVLLIRLLRSINSEDLRRFSANYKRLLREHASIDYIDLPTMVMTGVYDKFVRFEDLQRFDHYCSDLTIVGINSADHFYSLQSKELEDIIDSFIVERKIRDIYGHPMIVK